MTTSRLNRRSFLQTSAALGASSILPAARAQSTKTLKFGHMLPPDQVHHKAIALFGEELGKLSKNSIKVDIFPSSQMGSIPEMLQSVQAGSLSMSMAVPAWYSSFMKPLDAFTLPYLVGNEEKLRPALEGPLGAQINKFAEPAGFKVLGYLLLGARSIVNKQRAQHSETIAEKDDDRHHESPDEDLPIKRYDHLTVEEIVSKLNDLSKADIRKIKAYEQQHTGRKTLIEQIDSRLD